MDPFTAPPPKKNKFQPQNFAEALKSIGGHTAQSVGQNVIGGFGRDLMSGVFGGPPKMGDSPYSENQANPDWLKQKEQEWREDSERQKRHQEIINAKPVYDRREEEVKAQIKALQDELKALAKDLANLSMTTQQALNEAITHPGKYHVSYLEKLRRFIINLRKQVTDSNNWLEISYTRRQAKNHYWGGVQKAGTKFMLSQERQVATSAG